MIRLVKVRDLTKGMVLSTDGCTITGVWNNTDNMFVVDAKKDGIIKREVLNGGVELPIYFEDLAESYYVTIRSANNDSRRTERIWAKSFEEAETGAYITCNLVNDEEIISIERDYKI